MMPPKAFDTLRLHLRSPAMADAQVLFDLYMQDPEVTRYLIWRPHASIKVTREFLQRCLQQDQEGNWVIERRQDNQILGWIGLELRTGDHRAELGYVLAKAFWGQGYMTEAARCLVDWAIAQPGIYRVWATCDVDNHASARVLEKVGMQREGLLRRWIMHPNVSDKPRDSWSYAKVK